MEEGLILPIVSSIEPVIKALTAQLQVWDTSLSCVYDPSLTYETAVEGYRNYKTNLELKKTSVFPLFAYNRTTLEPAREMAMRAMEMLGTEPITDSDTATEYIATLAEFELNFLYIHPDMPSIERFEILYNAQLGIQTKALTLNLGSLGNFDYQVYWHLLSPNLTVSAIENGYFKMVGGSCKVRGAFLAILNELPLVTQINTTAYASTFASPYQWDQIYPTNIGVADSTVIAFGEWLTGTPVTFTKNLDSQVLPTPLVAGQIYYVIGDGERPQQQVPKVPSYWKTTGYSASHIKLALTASDARDGKSIMITDAGDVSTGSYFIMAIALESQDFIYSIHTSPR